MCLATLIKGMNPLLDLEFVALTITSSHSLKVSFSLRKHAHAIYTDFFSAVKI